MDDRHRQEIIERIRWCFWRCFASTWKLHKPEMIEDLLNELGIKTLGLFFVYKTINHEQRVVKALGFDPLHLLDETFGINGIAG